MADLQVRTKNQHLSFYYIDIFLSTRINFFSCTQCLLRTFIGWIFFWFFRRNQHSSMNKSLSYDILCVYFDSQEIYFMSVYCLLVYFWLLFTTPISLYFMIVLHFFKFCTKKVCYGPYNIVTL